jgi:cardiolipin synthase (CMP-forming)
VYLVADGNCRTPPDRPFRPGDEPAERAHLCAHRGSAGAGCLPVPARWSAVTVFVVACITDWLDGYLARIWDQQSALGRMLDPIADKLLVGAALLMLVHDNTIGGWQIWAAVIILSREILVSGLREYLAELNVKVHVSQLAKWKTTMQMVALGILIAGPAAEKLIPGLLMFGTGVLWIAAGLTLFTGYDYLKAAIRHAMEA